LSFVSSYGSLGSDPSMYTLTLQVPQRRTKYSSPLSPYLSTFSPTLNLLLNIAFASVRCCYGPRFLVKNSVWKSLISASISAYFFSYTGALKSFTLSLDSKALWYTDSRFMFRFGILVCGSAFEKIRLFLAVDAMLDVSESAYLNWSIGFEHVLCRFLFPCLSFGTLYELFSSPAGFTLSTMRKSPKADLVRCKGFVLSWSSKTNYSASGFSTDFVTFELCEWQSSSLKGLEA